MRNVYTKLVPAIWTDEQKVNIVMIADKHLERVWIEIDFIDNVITGYEKTGAFQYH